VALDLDLERDPAAIRGTDLNAFTEGLTRARVPAFLIDLWTPASAERGMFFTAFYKNLASQSRGAALRQAKLEMRKSNPDSLAWAAYVLRGDNR
jgi:CHAT domain-containing protein